MPVFFLAAAKNLQQQGKFSESIEFVMQAKNEFLQLSEKYSQNTNYISSLSESILLEAKTVKDNHSRHELCRNSKNLLSSIIKKDKSPNFTVFYIKSLDCLGEVINDKELKKLLLDSQILNTRF